MSSSSSSSSSPPKKEKKLTALQQCIKNMVEEHYEKIKHLPVLGNDISILGMSPCRYLNDKTMPVVDTTDLHFTKDGRYYKKCNEGHLVEIVYNWIGEHWKDYFKGVGFITLEKQMTRLKSNDERACLDINMILHTAFYLLHMLFGGPLVLVIDPKEWKRRMGIKVGHDDKKSVKRESCVINGVFYQSELNPHYKENKARAEDRFSALAKVNEAFHLLSERIPSPTTDEMESTLIAKFTYDNLKELIERAMTYRNHDKVVNFNQHLSILDKMQRLPVWENYIVDPFPVTQPKVTKYITHSKEDEKKVEKAPKKKKTSIIVIEESND